MLTNGAQFKRVDETSEASRWQQESLKDGEEGSIKMKMTSLSEKLVNSDDAEGSK